MSTMFFENGKVIVEKIYYDSFDFLYNRLPRLEDAHSKIFQEEYTFEEIESKIKYLSDIVGRGYNGYEPIEGEDYNFYDFCAAVDELEGFKEMREFYIASAINLPYILVKFPYVSEDSIICKISNGYFKDEKITAELVTNKAGEELYAIYCTLNNDKHLWVYSVDAEFKEICLAEMEGDANSLSKAYNHI